MSNRIADLREVANQDDWNLTVLPATMRDLLDLVSVARAAIGQTDPARKEIFERDFLQRYEAFNAGQGR